MTTITKITYPVPNENMGGTTEAESDKYREWFAGQLRAEYPGVEISVTDEPGRLYVEIDSDDDPTDAQQLVHEFGNLCWERCHWDWL